MSENNEHHDEHGHDAGHHVNYFKIYVILLILFLISVVGPEVGEVTGLRWITLITAFGIAVVKARLVVNNFMHLAWEKRIMKWVLATSLVLMLIMVSGISPDVMNHEGQRWENIAAKAEVERGLAYAAGYAEEESEAEPEVMVAAAFSAEASFGQICATCHGVGGAGDGVAGAALNPPPANFTDPAFWADPARDRDRVITVIRDGAAAVGGSALMAPWGALYTEEQLEQVADYVMSFRPDAD